MLEAGLVLAMLVSAALPWFLKGKVTCQAKSSTKGQEVIVNGEAR